MDAGGTAYTNPSSGKIDQQRKILEDLERQKKLLKSGGGLSSPLNLGPPGVGGMGVGVSPGPQPPSVPGGPTVVGSEGHITTGQRTALESANKTSFGFFIPQDSAFGNIILPVIPRIQPKNPPAVAK